MRQTHTAVLSDDGGPALDTLLHAAVERHDVPGVVAEVTNRQRTLYRGAFGKLDERGAVGMPADAIFQIYSMTKLVTSAAIMMLKEQGLLGLDDMVSRYLPELKGIEVIAAFDESDGSYATRPAACEITLRHLLTHTAGFGYAFSNHTISKLSDRLPDNPPLLHDPGSRWNYGPSTRVLGRVVERITGEPLDVFFESRIFQPLGMEDTGFDLKPEDCPRMAPRFRRINGQLVGEQNPVSYEPRVFGDGGLLATANDYIRFLQMLLGLGQFGGSRLLKEQSVTEMTKNQIGNLVVEKQPGAIPDISNPFPLGAGEDNFGLGFQLQVGAESGARSPGSYSWSGLHNTHFWADPKQGIAAMLMMQVLPFFEDRCIQLLMDFEESIYRNLE